MYENLVVQCIREQYSQDDENKVIREYLSDMSSGIFKTAFDSYNAYVLTCKTRAHEEIYPIN